MRDVICDHSSECPISGKCEHRAVHAHSEKRCEGGGCYCYVRGTYIRTECVPVPVLEADPYECWPVLVEYGRTTWAEFCALKRLWDAVDGVSATAHAEVFGDTCERVSFEVWK